MEWNIQTSKNGEINVKIDKGEKSLFLHSRYNPLKEAADLVKNINIPFGCRDIIVISMGAGFHVQELANQYPNLNIYVLEFNHLYARWTLKNLPQVKKLIQKKQIKYIFSDDIKDLKDIVNQYLFESTTELYIYKQALELIEDTELRLWFKQIRLLKTSYDNQKDKMEQNFCRNVVQNPKGLTYFSNRYQNHNFVLVSAGPSLTKQLPLLKKIANEKKNIIACVGTSLKLLLQYNIVPHFVMIADANDEIMNQFDCDLELEIPLFFLSTANYGAVDKYTGPKYIVWQEGYIPSEEYAKLKKEPLILTGGSVATCLLDLIVKLGAKSIALVGQDLAFTNNQTHAQEINSSKKIISNESLIEMDDFYQENKVYTSLNLYTYKKWFENYALNVKETIDLWNCTEGGAYIDNWKHETLENFAKKNSK